MTVGRNIRSNVHNLISLISYDLEKKKLEYILFDSLKHKSSFGQDHLFFQQIFSDGQHAYLATNSGLSVIDNNLNVKTFFPFRPRGSDYDDTHIYLSVQTRGVVDGFESFQGYDFKPWTSYLVRINKASLKIDGLFEVSSTFGLKRLDNYLVLFLGQTALHYLPITAFDDLNYSITITKTEKENMNVGNQIYDFALFNDSVFYATHHGIFAEPFRRP